MANTRSDTRLKAVAMVEILALAFVIGAALATPLIPSARAATYTVDADSPNFVPDYRMIQVGDTITWVNADGLLHTVVSNNASWTTLNLPSGGSASHTFNALGIYDYHCGVHIGMTGTIEVVTVIPEFSTMPLVILGTLVIFLGLVLARKGR